MDGMTNFLAANDPEVWASVANEIERQHDGLELIASENYTSPAIMQAAGSVLTNKYAEGYRDKRYYNGCEQVNAVEQLVIERAKALLMNERSLAEEDAYKLLRKLSMDTGRPLAAVAADLLAFAGVLKGKEP